MRKLILIILFGLSYCADAQIIRANGNYIAQETAPAFSYIGDVVSGIKQGYSFRKLRSAYTGNCIRVRRSNDDAEQDFGFLNNYLDTSALLSFVGANSGFIVKLYDHSGNLIDAIANSNSQQARIINSGVFDRLNGKPAMLCINANANFYSFTNTTYNDFTWLTITKKTNTSGTGSIIFGQSGNGAMYVGEDIDNLGNPTLITPAGALIFGASLGAGFNASPSGGEILNKITYYNRAGALCNGGINGAVFTPTSRNSVAFTINQLFHYASAPGGYNYDGYVQEIIMYNSDKGSNRTTLETNINSFYTIY